MSDYPLSKYSAKIKDVYIELKNYRFFHSPYDETATKGRFIGREKVKNRIFSILDRTDVKSGSYLITGFRGMGKTSLVREALDDFNNKQKHDAYKIVKGLLDSLFSEMMKAVRILIFCYTIFLILQYFFSDLFSFHKFKFLIQSSILFSTVFSLSFLFNNYKSISDSSDLARNQSKQSTNSKKIFLIICFILITLLPTFILILLYFSYFEGLNEFLNKVKLDIFSFSPRCILLFAFSIIAIITSISNDFFAAIWNYFKIFVVIVLLVISTMYFFNYKYVCETSGWCKSNNELMNNYFPPLSFSKKSEPNNNISVTNSFNESQFLTTPTGDSSNLEEKNKELVLQTEADVIAIIFRLIISILLSYIIISTIVFFIDLIYSLRIHLLKPQNAKESKKYKQFEINLSQDSLDEMEILRRMTIEIENYWQERKFDLGSNLFNRKLYFPWRYIIKKVDRPRKDQFEPSYKIISGKLNLLKNRMSGQLTTRRERKTPPNITTPIADLFEIEMPLGGDTNNDEISYPIASVKEAEDQLREILKDIDKLRTSNERLGIPQFVFIIDELDKIDPHNSSIVQERESSNPVLDTNIYVDDTNRFRQRREAVGRLLANLKGFLNVAKAKFFFIGGREMFDADLAGISDRESFYSSIFNDVIYVESFFKDSVRKDGQSTGGITQMTETYICNIILNDFKDSEIEHGMDKLNLEALFSLINTEKDKTEKNKSYLLFKSKPDESNGSKNGGEDEANRQKYKIISTLQNYIVYLTYRSSGTPKKLTTLTEQLVVRGPKFEENCKEKNERFYRENVVVLHKEPTENEDLSDRLFLKFGFNTQYEINLTSNLYRPYLIVNSRSFKSLGDKLLFSSSYIIDHILKFHPFGFSWRNLEFIPEVVLVNREPNLREFIEELMRFYSLNYIRDTVSGIFDYRFRSIIRRELIHLSKTSDLSAAAFNFTLDESLATKRYYKRKLNELNAKYKDNQLTEGDNQFVHSIYFVQTILGDLHFYDKEYDDAILYYTESIQTLRLPNAITDRKITRHQFLLWVKNKLKLGLTLEKIRAFDSAFSIYKTLVLDAERYFENIVSKEDSESSKWSVFDYFYENNNRDDRKREAEDHRSIHLISMPFVALLAVTEKLRSDGITYTNLFTNREDFYRTIKFSTSYLETDDKTYDQKFDKYRKFYLIADYYNNVGTILYYKNCQFINFFKESDYYLEAFKQNNGKLDLIKQQTDIYDTKEKPYDFFPSLSPFNFYWNSLYFLLKYHQDRLVDKVAKKLSLSGTNKDSLKDNLLALCAGYLLPECVDMVSSNRLYYIANVVSKIGDSILASLNKEAIKITAKKFNTSDISEWGKNKFLTDKEDEVKENIKGFKDNLDEKKLFTAETVLYTYKLAAALYKRAGYSSYYVAHLKRILYLVKDLIELNKDNSIQKNNIKGFLAIDTNSQTPFQELEGIAETIFRATTWNNEVSNRPQILKYRQIFGISANRNENRQLIYSIVNNISDIKEAVVLVESIKLKLDYLFEGSKDDFIKKHFTPGRSLSSAYGTISSRYQRMLELKYRTERCYYIMNDVLKLGALFKDPLLFEGKTDEVKKEVIAQIKEIIREEIDPKTNITIHDVVAFLIQEALFCSTQLIKKIKLYNPGYVIGYSFIAESHRRMGDWCQAYDNYLKIIDEGMDEIKIYEKHLRALEIRVCFLRRKCNLINGKLVGIRQNYKNWEKNKTKTELILKTNSNVKKCIVDKLNNTFINNTTDYSYKILKDLIENNFRKENPIRFFVTYADFYEKHLADLGELINAIEKFEDWKNNQTSIDQVINESDIKEIKKELKKASKQFTEAAVIEEIYNKFIEKLNEEFINHQDTYSYKILNESIMEDYKNQRFCKPQNQTEATLGIKFDDHLKTLATDSSDHKDWEENVGRINEVIGLGFEVDKIKEDLTKESKPIDNKSVNEEICNRFLEKLNKEFINYQGCYSYKTLENWISKNSKIKNLKKDNKDYILKNKFNEGIKGLLGGEGLIYLESKNHYETAVLYYYKMIELHSDGKAYKDKLHEIHMLEDDYNDSMAHYTIAAERVRINTGKVKEKINKINEKIEGSKLYKYDSYLSSNNDDEVLDIEAINNYLDYFAKEIKDDSANTNS